MLPEEVKGAAVEVSAYWVDSFGNKSRIDYGTGHEMNFLIFLFCVEKALRSPKSVEGNADVKDSEPEKKSEGIKGALVTIVFVAYMDLVRKLQVTYRMEPAGKMISTSFHKFQRLRVIAWNVYLFRMQHEFMNTDFLGEFRVILQLF